MAYSWGAPVPPRQRGYIATYDPPLDQHDQHDHDTDHDTEPELEDAAS